MNKNQYYKKVVKNNSSQTFQEDYETFVINEFIRTNPEALNDIKQEIKLAYDSAIKQGNVVLNQLKKNNIGLKKLHSNLLTPMLKQYRKTAPKETL